MLLTDRLEPVPESPLKVCRLALLLGRLGLHEVVHRVASADSSLRILGLVILSLPLTLQRLDDGDGLLLEVALGCRVL